MEKIDLNKEIIVIGNGSSVLQYKIGEIIDKFGNIIRFNDFQTKGYEKYIGSRTTIWARSNSLRTKNRNRKLFNEILVSSPEWNFESAKRLASMIKNAVLISKKDTLDLQNLLDLPGRIVKKGKKPIRGWPSSGLIVLYYLLIHRFETIYIHGFDNFVKINIILDIIIIIKKKCKLLMFMILKKKKIG
jgi:hypothetical protein